MVATLLEPVRVFTSYRDSVIARSQNTTNSLSTSLTELLFETKYGLRLEFCRRNNSYLIKICDTSNAVGEKNADHTNRCYHYRILPDWQTSFIWQNDPRDDCVVEDETVERLYPALAPFFFAWRDVYETEFERQECHLGSHVEVFPNARARVAWEMEGFFMSCWLASQNEVESVEYYSSSKTCRVEKDMMALELHKFLGNMGSLLEM